MSKTYDRQNDRVLTEMTDIDFKYDDFPYKQYFTKIGHLIPDNDKECVSLDLSFDRKDLVYIFVIDGIIIKIGSTSTTMKNRIQSYNCGKKAYRKNGTCSTTNYVCLQSILNINKKVDVYAFFPEDNKIDVWGIEKEISVSKLYEKRILTDLKDKGVFPVLCIQR
jgi:hypothetical protein